MEIRRGLAGREAALAGACTGLALLLAEALVAAASRPSAVAAAAHGAPWRLLAPVLALEVLAALAGWLVAAALGARGPRGRDLALCGALLGAAAPVLVHPLLVQAGPLAALGGALAALLLVLAAAGARGRRAFLLPGVAALLAAVQAWWLLAAGPDPAPAFAPADDGWLATAGRLATCAALPGAAALACLPLSVALRRPAERATRALLVATAITLLALLATWSLGRLATALRGRAEGAPTDTPVLLVVADTLRADHVTGFGGADGLTPRVAALARDGVSFGAAYAAAPWTTPSFGSLLTGQLPLDHGAGAGGQDVLRPDLATLAGELRARGYTTIALTSNPLLARRHGLGRGFVRYEDAVPPEWYHPLASWVMDRVARRAAPYLDGPAQAARALEAVDEAGSAHGWLVLAHFMDSHWPYRAPDRLRSLEAPGLAGDCRAGARAVDEALGVLLDGLRDRGLYDRALIVFTADHGEELDEQRAESASHAPFNRHGHTLYDEQLHVPLVIKLPAGDTRLGAPGSVRADPVSLTDLHPTLLAALGSPPPADLAGRDLAAEPRDGRARPLFAEGLLASAEGEGLSARRGGWKVVLHGLPPRPDRCVGFDLASDPGERAPLPLTADPELGALYEWLVARWMGLPAARVAGEAEAAPPVLDDVTRRMLQQLGYLR